MGFVRAGVADATPKTLREDLRAPESEQHLNAKKLRLSACDKESWSGGYGREKPGLGSLVEKKLIEGRENTGGRAQ